ncbi:dTMP kinase [Lapidilactobacillus luobeiensis]|uniref:dTMP kinase n=1 Tax=Lapidilactobacillus luobeiensis TaxID=2950371 RepID=UPI0021C2E43A|nr:dTMP kinase [Lapidilactobacillus luobeiensis]
MAGFFISFEGPDGAGKSTVIQRLVEPLIKATGQEVIVTREPGGSAIAEQIRHIILDVANTEMDDWTEALLFAASRRQHLVEVVEPALAANKIVLCDRFVDSSIAYQGGGHQLGMAKVAALNDFAIQGHYPDLTLYLDVPVEVGLRRVQKLGAGFDRLEGQQLAFHERVRATYQQLLKSQSARMVQVDASQPAATVVATCLDVIQQRYN